jgi:hypothetical protein
MSLGTLHGLFLEFAFRTSYIWMVFVYWLEVLYAPLVGLPLASDDSGLRLES